MRINANDCRNFLLNLPLPPQYRNRITKKESAFFFYYSLLLLPVSSNNMTLHSIIFNFHSLNRFAELRDKGCVFSQIKWQKNLQDHYISDHEGFFCNLPVDSSILLYGIFNLFEINYPA